MPTISPIPPLPKTTARDLFGADSEDEDEPAEHAASKSGKKIQPMYSYFTRKIARGYSRQSDENKVGSHYIELKIYKCDEIKNVLPLNRWRHAIVAIKNRTNDNTEAWRRLSEFVAATRKEFRENPPTFINSYF